MKYRISYTSSAAKALRKLDKNTAKRILEKISTLAHDPRPQGCKQLIGGDGEFRVRVGDYRVVCDIHDGELIVLVLSLGHRREIYR